MIHVVLLSGGSGTRLWPLSNSARSKQFLKVLRDGDGNHVSMVQRVFGQIEAVSADISITIATSAAQADVLSLQVGGRYALAMEPERRDTAPAIMLACAHIGFEQGANADDPVVVMPIDTYADQAYYDCIPKVAEAVIQGTSDLVLLGVRPTHPSDRYGYIIPTSTEGDVWGVKTFREKPDIQTARAYIEQGGLWNCGVFGFKLGWLRSLSKGYLPAKSYEECVARYGELPKNSFDYEVVERAESISVIPYEGRWEDLGTWDALSEEMVDETAGNVIVDAQSTSGVHAINETGLPMVIAGVSNVVVVATPDGLLVSGKDESSRIKGLLEEASVSRPMCERRSWGEYRVVDDRTFEDGTHALSMMLEINAGKTMACEPHRNGTKVWTVTHGAGEAMVNGVVTSLAPGASLAIPAQVEHSARATTPLGIVETLVV